MAGPGLGNGWGNEDEEADYLVHSEQPFPPSILLPIPLFQACKTTNCSQEPALYLWLYGPFDQHAGDRPWCWAWCSAVEAQLS